MKRLPNYLFYTLLLLFSVNLKAQLLVKELPDYDITGIDSVLFNQTETRQIQQLRNGWQVHFKDTPESKATISIPAAFNDEASMVFEKKIVFRHDKLQNYTPTLYFLGLNYSAEVMINDKSIYKHAGGLLPFQVELPFDLLKINEENTITIDLEYKLDSETSIPLENGFLSPTNIGGILRDVYLQYIPKKSLEKIDTEITLNDNLNDAEINISAIINNRASVKDSTAPNYRLAYRLTNGNGTVAASGSENGFTLVRNKTKTVSLNFGVNNPSLWDVDNPNLYKLTVSLYNNDLLVDRTIESLAFKRIIKTEDGITLNGSPLILKGTTYSGSYEYEGTFTTYEQLRKDLELIKATGFNVVRFTKHFPHPYSLRLCEQLGLLAFVELPYNTVPYGFFEKDSFAKRAENNLRLLLRENLKYNSVAAVGFGESYTNGRLNSDAFIERLSRIVKNEYGKIAYASFIGYPKEIINSLDYYGIELYSKPMEAAADSIARSIEAIGKNNLFISGITYPAYLGSRNGYLSGNTDEAQAKYFEDAIDYVSKNELRGFFINSFFDYRGNYSSLYASYTKDNLYKIGLLGAGRDRNRIAYKVVNAKLTESERISIPIGSRKEDTPLMFIILALVLSIVMALLFNSKRKFREDAGRALIRPYNFYADIRDHRILSGFHTSALLIILAGAHSLWLTNILYYLRSNILLEKILLSFGIPGFTSIVSFLAWNPIQSFLYLFAFSVVLFFIVSFIVKFASLLVKNKVYYSSIYHTVIWSFLPLALLLPIELVLYKVLASQVINMFVYIFLILYLLWQVQRLLKGVYVIFDTNPSAVYIYSFLFIAVISAIVFAYFQFTADTVSSILTVFNQYKLM